MSRSVYFSSDHKIIKRREPIKLLMSETMDPVEKTQSDVTPIPPDGDDFVLCEAIVRSCTSLESIETVLMYTTPFYGGEGGEPFDDGLQNESIESISIRHGSSINAIAVNYELGERFHHGGDEGVEMDPAVVLQSGEYLTAIDVWYGRAVHCLTFHSNLQRKFGPFGRPDEHNVTVQAPPGYVLASFNGRAGTCIDAIGFRFRPIHSEYRWSVSGDDIIDVAPWRDIKKEGGKLKYNREYMSQLVDAVRDVLSSFFVLKAQAAFECQAFSSALKVYEQALVNILRSAESCLCVPSSHEQGEHDREYRRFFLYRTTRTMNEVTTSLQRIDSWEGSHFCLAPKVQKVLIKHLNYKLAKLDVVVLQLMEIEMFTFGAAVHVQHPVLQLAWALARRSERDESCLERSLLVDNLMALLGHEIGDAALMQMEAFWRDCVTSFVSKLGDDPECEVLFVADLNRRHKLPPLGKHLTKPTGNYSVRQMLIESEFSHGSEGLWWKGDPSDDTFIIKLASIASTEESKLVCKFIVPQLELLLGVDVWAAVEAFDTKRDGLAIVQYQVCDHPPQDTVVCFESGNVKITVGSGAAQPGDDIKILIKGSQIKKESPIHLRVLQVSAIVLTSKVKGKADSEVENLDVSDIEEHPNIGDEHCFCRAPILDWGVIDTLDVLKSMTALMQKWRVHCYLGALSSIRESTQHLIDTVEMDWPSSWLPNKLCDFLRLLNLRLKVFDESLQWCPHSRLEEEVKSQFDEIARMVSQLKQLVSSIFGSAIRIQHPVLRQVWMLAGPNQRCVSKMERWLFAKILWALLEQELGGGVSNDHEIWKEKVRSFVFVIGREDNDDVLTEDLNEACPSPIPPEHSARKMLEKSVTIGWGSSPLVVKRVIIQQEVDHNSVLNLLVKVVSKVGELQSILCLEQEIQTNLQWDYSVLDLWLWTCQCLSVAVDLLPKEILDDVRGILILTLLVLEASCNSTKQIKAAVFQKWHYMQILKEQFSELCQISCQMAHTERSIFGSAQKLSDPVLQRVWALVGADWLHMGSTPRILCEKILLALLHHEIGDAAFKSSEAIWRSCSTSFLLKLGDVEDGKVSVFGLKRVGRVQLPGDHSTRRMLVESECSYDIERFCWRGDVGGCHMFVKQTTLSLVQDMLTHTQLESIDESFHAKFMIPQLEVFLGVDVSVDLEVNDSKVQALATVQFQVGDSCSQLGCLVWCKSSNFGFTIGSANAKPGNSIKIWITWPKIVGFLVNVRCVKASAICIIANGP